MDKVWEALIQTPVVSATGEKEKMDASTSLLLSAVKATIMPCCSEM